MNAIKEWVVKRVLLNVVGQALAKADGKRTWYATGAYIALLVAKYGLPIFVSVPPIVTEGIDAILPMVGGSALTFAGIKAQKGWDAAKKIGDEVIKAEEVK